jgi:hypothetical protein
MAMLTFGALASMLTVQEALSNLGPPTDRKRERGISRVVRLAGRVIRNTAKRRSWNRISRGVLGVGDVVAEAMPSCHIKTFGSTSFFLQNGGILSGNSGLNPAMPGPMMSGVGTWERIFFTALCQGFQYCFVTPEAPQKQPERGVIEDIPLHLHLSFWTS